MPGEIDVTEYGSRCAPVSPAFTMWAPSGAGDLAVLAIHGKMVHGACRSLGMAEHTIRDRQPGIVQAYTLPLTGACWIDRIVKTLAAMDVTDRALCLIETAPA